MRLDQYVSTHFDLARDAAIELIKNGGCLLNGRECLKPSTKTTESDKIELISAKINPYVSRAGLKLKQALAEFSVNPRGLECLDIGSSTGGFTDCLLQHGAKKVTCVDVGTNQLANKLTNSPKIELHEQTDIRNFQTKTTFDLITIDVSFISLFKILPELNRFSDNNSIIIALYKPQFEHGKKFNDSVKQSISKLGFQTKQYAMSAQKGKSGTQEWLVLLTTS